MSSIEIVGSIDTQHYYQPDYISEILSNKQQSFGADDGLMGRPDTQIYMNAQDVVKMRAELDLSEGKVHQWTASILKKEQELGVHHPHKTWFIIHNDIEGENTLVGSICPRLKPLNIELKTAPHSEAERQRYLTILEAVFKQYFTLAKQTGFKLDEGLSNVAIDSYNSVFYLDDEYYKWDNFITFSLMFGVFLRGFTWLDTDFIQKLTQILVKLLDSIFEDPHCRTIIRTQIESLFMPNDEKERLLKIVTTGLLPASITQIHDKNQPSEFKASKATTAMKERYIAVFADVHANEAALDCVLDFYKQQNITQGIVLGDIVGYGPDPKACIEKLQNSSFEIIKGNHDHAVGIKNCREGFSNSSRAVINWTIDLLDEEYIDWLKHLPAYYQHDDWFAVHGAPMDPAFFYGYVYLMTAEDNLDYMQDKKMSLCFHGHSHMPGIYTRKKSKALEYLTVEKVILQAYKQSLVCPGSVGQPRNGNPNAQCAVYDKEIQEMTFISLPYPLDKVVERIQANNLPSELWQRLQTGK